MGAKSTPLPATPTPSENEATFTMSTLASLVTQQADFERRSEVSHAASKQTFHLHQEEDWRNDVARELNTILGRVQYEMETCLPPDEFDVEFAEAALAIVQRVAEFEEIERGK